MITYYFFPLALIFSSSLGIIISPSWATAPFVWVLIIVPIIDYILPNLNKNNAKLYETTLHNIALIIILPCIFFLILFGLFEVAKNNDGLATIMGHEIAHAVAKHSIERMSQAMTVNVGTQVADIFLGGEIIRTRNTVGRATGMDIFQLGIMNPFGRKQETEADYLGLIFASLAGFNITESIKLWERMAEAKKGKEPPQFLSTHPSSKNRIENLKEWVNQIIIEYPPIIT